VSALAALHSAGIMPDEEFRFLESSYRFLRTIEGRLRLMNSTARDQLPKDAMELNKLAHLLRYSSGEALLCDYERTTHEIRRRFDATFDAAGKQRT
jgi:glutamate-ammonia-ligase adenylyltransferase